MGGFRYSTDHIAFLTSGFKKMRIPALTKAFNEKFSLSKTEKQIKTALTSRKIRCGRPGGLRKGERLLLFNQEQIEFMRVEYKKLSIKELTQVLNKTFTLSVSAEQVKTFTTNQKISSGRTGRYEKGNVPWTAGTAGMGVCKPNSGCFAKGSVPKNKKPIGHERTCSKDGYVLVKVAEENPHTGFFGRYRQKHVVVWEKVNGVVPDGMCLRFLDGDRTNCVVENLVLVTRAEHVTMTRLGFGSQHFDVRPSVVALAKLQVKFFEIARARKESGGVAIT